MRDLEEEQAKGDLGESEDQEDLFISQSIEIAEADLPNEACMKCLAYRQPLNVVTVLIFS